MGKSGMSYLLSQLGYQAPALLVYLVAFILALVYMRRASIPCILTLVGVGILVITMLGMAVMQASLIDSRQAYWGDSERVARLMGIIGLAGSYVRAAGLSFLVAAIFVGRRSQVSGWSEPGAA
jgi:hypothetical protein